MSFFKVILKLFLTVTILVVVVAGYVYYQAHRIEAGETDPLVVNDTTGLNPVTVSRVVKPKTEQEIVDALQSTRGPVSIGGARYSMGGQISYPDSLHFDMRDYNQVLAFDPEKKLITVQTGITWRQVQEHIDPHDLSVSVMQDFNNFTVGGSLSVNAHGRNLKAGTIINTVKSIKIALANGTVLQASPNLNNLLFYGAIGGYGALGVITEATLQLVDNNPIERSTSVVRFDQYLDYFKNNILNDESVLLHNAILYPPHFETLLDISWRESNKTLTTQQRLSTIDEDNWWKPVIIDWLARFNFLKRLRQNLIDRYVYSQPAVVLRNLETSHDLREWGFNSQNDSTLAIREYFVPIDSYEVFVLKMRDVFIRHNVDVLNLTIRYVAQDTASILSWARQDMFSFLVVYRQDKDQESQQQVAEWSSKLIEGAVESGGSFYMPFQIHETTEQFNRAYPNADFFFKLKQRADPDNRFINHLWLQHYAENKPYRDALQARKQQPATDVEPEEEPVAETIEPMKASPQQDQPVEEIE